MHTRKSVLISLLVVVMIFSLTAAVVLADELINPDKRINQVHHFGGDALYCVDANMVPTTDFDTMMAGGGLRLLNSEGQELWFAPASDILAAMVISAATGDYEPFDTGFGTFGPTDLSVLVDGLGKVSFMMTGYDEHLKTNLMLWDWCLPVNAGNFGDDPEVIVSQEEEEEPCRIGCD